MHRHLFCRLALTCLALAGLDAGAQGAETIRQWQLAPQGDKLELALREVAAPAPARNEVAVRVRAVSLNRRDLMMVAGRYGRGGTQPNSVPLSDGAGEVIAVGPGKRNDEGKREPLDVKVGDRILFGKYSGSTVVIEGTEYLVMREEDIMGVVA